MPRNDVAKNHLRELAARKSVAYELLVHLEQLSPSVDADCFKNLSELVDRVVFHEVRVPAEVTRRFEDMARSNTSELGQLLDVWQQTFKKAEPSRAGMRLVLANYADWLTEVSASARPAFLEALPRMAQRIHELGLDGMRTIILALNACTSSTDCGIVAKGIAAYGRTSGSILLAVARIARDAAAFDATTKLETVIGAVPPDTVLDAKDSRNLLPATARVSKHCANLGKTAWLRGIDLCLALATRSHSSACVVAEKLPTLLTELSPGADAAYMDAFSRLVETIGVSIVGFGITKMPRVFRDLGAPQAMQFVDVGIYVAEKYGRKAGKSFFDERTSASRSHLSHLSAHRLRKPVG